MDSNSKVLQIVSEVHADIRSIRGSIEKLETRLVMVEDDYKFRSKLWKFLFGPAGLASILFVTFQSIKAIVKSLI